MQKCYCLECKRETNDTKQNCDCGGKTFIYGEKFRFVKDTVICDCGSSNFSAYFHMDYSDKSIANYYCTKCKNTIGIESYRDDDDLMKIID